HHFCPVNRGCGISAIETNCIMLELTSLSLGETRAIDNLDVPSSQKNPLTPTRTFYLMRL
ncbi:MAG TPA: hypothetical protein VLA84_03290, partial [Microcoleus sp.]|nr:hypothetical protein [Microcoleus sp.]